jgi:hypothetical protein
MIKIVGFILIFLLACPLSIFAKSTTLPDCTYATVDNFINHGSTEGGNTFARGDTVVCPACPNDGTCEWTVALPITVGVKFQGNGIDSTYIRYNITPVSGYDPIISFNPDASVESNSETIEVSGFTFNGNHKSNKFILNVGNSTNTATTRIKIHDNKFINGDDNMTAINIGGSIYGVAYANQFVDFSIILRSAGNDRDSWENMAHTWGDANTFFFENNTITFTGGLSLQSFGFVEGGNGGRYVSRYNTWNFTSVPAGLLDIHDAHGNQAYAIGEDYQSYATMAVEIYNNSFANVPVGQNNRLLAHRGGKALVYNNSTDSTITTITLAEEFADALAPVTGAYVQKINNSYFWNNTKAGAALTPTYASSNTGGYRCCSATEAWQTGHAYAAEYCFNPSGSTKCFKTSTGGTSHASDEPTWASSSLGGTLTDGTITWYDFGVWGTGAAPILVENTDFFNSTYSYTPYTCPHALTGLTGSCNATAGTSGYNVITSSSTMSGGTSAGGTF